MILIGQIVFEKVVGSGFVKIGCKLQLHLKIFLLNPVVDTLEVFFDWLMVLLEPTANTKSRL